MRLIIGPTFTKQLYRAASMPSSYQRVAIGVTGLALRPTIDLLNPDVDKETRAYSAAKTAIKVAITVFNGVLTRIVAEKFGHWLVNKGIITAINKNVEAKAFANGVALAMSFLATVVTTFTLDIPLINWGLNFALDKLFPGQRVARK